MSDSSQVPTHPAQVAGVPVPSAPSAHVALAAAPAHAAPAGDGAPTISVIVPVHNARSYLTECLDSLARQTFDDIEVVCVDDGSTDGSADVLRDYRGLGGRLRVATQPNAGAAAARNCGLDMARGTYVLFVDADDFIRLDACQLLVDRARDTGADIVVFGGKTFPISAWADDGFARTRAVRHDAVDAFFFEPGCFPLMCNKLYRRALIEGEHLRFSTDLVLGEDNVFQFSLFPVAKTIAFMPDKLYFYRIHSQSAFNRMADDNDRRLAIHMGVVEHALRLWHERGFLVGHERDLLNWAIEFLNRDAAHASLAAREAVGERLSDLLDATVDPRFAGALSAVRLGQLHHLAGARSQRQADVVLSVVVSPRRGTRLDPKTLGSVQRLADGAIEILVDASRTDEETRTLALADARARAFPTLSQAVEAARGTYLLFVTVGTEYDPTLIPQLLGAVDETTRRLEGLRAHGACGQDAADSRAGAAPTPSVAPAQDAAEACGWRAVARRQAVWRTGGVDAVTFTDADGILEHADPVGLIRVDASTVLDGMLVYPADAMGGGAWRLSSLAAENKLLARDLVVRTLRRLAAGPLPEAAEDPGALALASLSGARAILPTDLPLVTLRALRLTGTRGGQGEAPAAPSSPESPEQPAALEREARALAADLASSLAAIGRVACPPDVPGRPDTPGDPTAPDAGAHAHELEFARARGAWLVALLDTVRSPQEFSSLYPALRAMVVQGLDSDALKDAGRMDQGTARSLALMLAGADAQGYFAENACRLIDHLSAGNGRSLERAAESDRDAAEARAQMERYFHSVTYRVGHAVLAVPKALVNAVRKLRR